MGVVSLVECFGRSNRKYRRIDWRCDADSAAGKGLTSTGRPVAVRMLAIVDVGSRPTNAFRPIPESRAGCLRSFNAPNSLRVLCCNETPLILSHSSFPSNPHQSSVEPPIKPAFSTHCPHCKLQLRAAAARRAPTSPTPSPPHSPPPPPLPPTPTPPTSYCHHLLSDISLGATCESCRCRSEPLYPAGVGLSTSPAPPDPPPASPITSLLLLRRRLDIVRHPHPPPDSDHPSTRACHL